MRLAACPPGARSWRSAASVGRPRAGPPRPARGARAAVVLARAAREGAAVVAIDPHAGNDRGPQEIEGFASEAQSDHEKFLANLERAGVRERWRHGRLPSAGAHGEVSGPIDLLYIDGAHRYSPARDD